MSFLEVKFHLLLRQVVQWLTMQNMFSYKRILVNGFSSALNPKLVFGALGGREGVKSICTSDQSNLQVVSFF